MNENGPVGIYTIKPLYNFSPEIDLPVCMYKIKSIYDVESSYVDVLQDKAGIDTEVEKYQLKILEELENLQSQVLELKKELNITEQDSDIKVTERMQPQDIVIKSNPEYPPYSLWVFRQLLSDVFRVQLVTYLHSSLDTVPDTVKHLQAMKDIGPFDLTLTVIWKQTSGKDPEMMIDPIHQCVIEGEVNIARHLSRLLPSSYESDPITATEIDYWLEIAHSSLVHGSTREQNSFLKLMNTELGKNNYLVGNIVSVADIVLWSMIRQINFRQNLPTNVEKWWKNLSACAAFQLPSIA